LAQQAVEAGDADVVQALDPVGHELGRDRGFLRYREVRRARRHYEHRPVAAWLDRPRAPEREAWQGVVLEAVDRRGQVLGRLRRQAGDQAVAPRRRQPTGHGDDLVGRLSLAEDDLGKAVAQAPVVVQPREAEVLVGQRTETIEGLVDLALAAPDGLEQLG